MGTPCVKLIFFFYISIKSFTKITWVIVVVLLTLRYNRHP